MDKLKPLYEGYSHCNSVFLNWCISNEKVQFT